MKKVLIIDDDEDFLQSISFILVQEDYDCVTANSGKKGLEVAVKFRPDVVLCDVFMPNINGYETLHAFREVEELSLIPFIFLTAHSDPAMHRYAMDLGADDFLPKPVDPKEVISAINARLSRQQMLIQQVERQLQKMKTHLDEIQQLSEVTSKINAGLLLEEVCEQFYSTFKSIIPYNRIGLSLIEENGTMVRARWAKSESPNVKISVGYHQPLHDSSLEKIIKTKQPRIINDLEEYFVQHPNSAATKDIIEEGVRSSFTCPLIAMGKNIGFVFFSSFEKNTYKNEHTEIYLQIAGQLAIVVEKARLYQELIDLNNLKNKFLGIAAHDLRNPLGAIIGFSGLLKENEQLQTMPEQLEMLDYITRSANQALSLINDLLDISAIESGHLPLNKQKVPVTSIVNESIHTNNLFAGKKNISIIPDIKYHELSFMINVDAARIRQVLDNYLSNAVKYSHPQTTITVRITEHNGMMRFDVIDQGQGIPQHELDKLFQEYSRISVLPTAGEKSTGLGLAIVKKIVKAHNGEVGATSELGKGSTFFFTIPVQ